MRYINRCVLHSTKTDANTDIGFDEINQMHADAGVKPINGIHCGFHYIIKRNGTVQRGRAEHEVGQHCGKYDSESLGVCLIGSLDNFTQWQFEALDELIGVLKDEYPNIKVFKDL